MSNDAKHWKEVARQLSDDLAAANSRIAELKKCMHEVRNVAGDKLPASSGLTIMAMLEKGLRP